MLKSLLRPTLPLLMLSAVATTSFAGPPPLQDTRWQLAELPGLKAEADGKPPQRPELRFGAEGRYSANGGCNRVQSSYQLKPGQGLLLASGRTTLRGCAGGMAQEQFLLQALAQVTRYEIGADGLRLLDAEGKLLARFEAAAS